MFKLGKSPMALKEKGKTHLRAKMSLTATAVEGGLNCIWDGLPRGRGLHGWLEGAVLGRGLQPG